MRWTIAITALLAASCLAQDSALARRQFKTGCFSVVMPKPFLASKEDMNYVALTDESLYLVQAQAMPAGYQTNLKRASQEGPEALRKFLGKVPKAFGTDISETRTEEGMFHGNPCSRRFMKSADGSTGVALYIFAQNHVYVLLFASLAGDFDAAEAQRMFDSFRLEKTVPKDSPLAPNPKGLDLESSGIIT